MTAPAHPDGIDEVSREKGGVAWVSWFRLVAIGALPVIGLLGYLGGAPSPTAKGASTAATIEVHSPRRLRNGIFFEYRIAVTARQPVADAVVAVPSALWRDFTINTMIPAATEEEYVDGEYRFHFGPLDAGKSLRFKIDGQINPPHIGTTHARIRLLDGEREVTGVGISQTVLP
ncbi:hypothetical protein [Sphingomonas sp. LY160]|uniref:hypothetical protein n=1 Tax=Sphingomonas sp. LY160 TaxID=3095342 RepID=UPI002ADEE517|nr:hypothetical protein [Sphingomonas sp. LY160]MEA1072658.1 hypothetical protein [Sphingomonas sp. LY160]